MVDMKLMKIIGMYQILSPHSPKLFGFNTQLKYIAMIQTLVLVLLFFMFLLNILYCLDDVNNAMNYFPQVVSCANAIYKTYSIFGHSDTLWSCIQLTSIEYLSYKQHSGRILEIGRMKSKLLATFFVVWFVVFCFIWIIPPFINYTRENNTGNDNLVNYRHNVLNLVFPVTPEFYNEHFISYYLFESILTVIWSQGTLMFDVITISMCVTFSYQLKTIINSYRTFNISAHEEFIGKIKANMYLDCVNHYKRVQYIPIQNIMLLTF